MKAFFSKIWTWILAHKIIAIVVASVLVVGTTCAIVLPIALHEHSYATEWSSDADNHWHDATCKHKEEKIDLAAHTYTNACDTTCDVCGYARTVGAHVYDNACDNKCNVCSAERTVEPHVYYNACDTSCNVCGATRTITHDYADTLTADEATHYYKCSICGDKKDEAAHVFDKTVASSEYLKAEATATTKAQYYKSCVCGKASATEYFESDKAPANLQVSDISKTYDGTPVAEPTVTFDGVGAENFAYYKGNEKLTERPTDAGTYKVVVTVDETDTHAGDRVEREFTIAKKTLNYLELTKVYDGEGVLAYELGTEHGVVAGDTVLFYCDEAPDYIVGTYNLIPYDDSTSIDDPGADDRALLAGADKANYKFAERIEGKYKLCATITVTKRPVWAENVEFTYDGYTNWTGEESPNQIVFQNMANGETMDSSFVKWTFDSKNVGATLTSVTFVDEDDGRSNYVIDLSKCSASIIPRVIDNLTYAFEYNGMEYHQAVISKNEHSRIVGDDQISLEVCFATPDVGAALDTSEETGFEPGFVEENYVLGENYNFSIIKKVVTELPATLTAEYKSIYGVSEGLEALVEIDGIEATLIFVARKSDNNLLYNPGAYTNATITQASLGDNFDLQIDTTAKYTITVNPKKLPALNIKITEAQYNKGEFTLVVSKDGVYAPVKVTFSKANYQDVMVDAVFELIIDEDLFMQGREVIAFADSAYATAYQFVPDANGIVGTITIVANCDVQYDGSCNCGTSHLTETLTFTGGEAVGNSATIACDSDYEGGIYKIALEGGVYEFFGTDQFFNISGIYDVNGNKLAGSIGTYALPKGTYYFHVYTGNSPYMDTIWVKKTGKMLDEATMANAIVPDMEPGNSDVGVRIHNLQTHNGGDTFVLFYNVGEDVNALGHEIYFRYEDGDEGYSATSNIENIEFYDVNGFQLDVTYDEPDMLAASGVTAVGGVYIVVTMNGEGMDNLYFYAV